MENLDPGLWVMGIGILFAWVGSFFMEDPRDIPLRVQPLFWIFLLGAVLFAVGGIVLLAQAAIR